MQERRGTGLANAASLPLPCGAPRQRSAALRPHEILFWIWRCRKQRYSTYDMPPEGVLSSTSAE